MPLLYSFVVALALTLACGNEEPGEGPDASIDEVSDDEAGSYCAERTACEHPAVPTEHSCVFYIGFDGSGVYSPDRHTSVGRLYELTAGPAAQGGGGKWSGTVHGDTTRAYIEGVPALPFGASAERVDRGLSAVCQHLDNRLEPCDIVMVGYSRGAIIANQVASALDTDGCGDHGRHRGAKIAFFGAFDPVHTQMGNEWRGRSWGHTIPGNVVRFVQVYKDPHEDPRGWPEGSFLTTTPHDGSAARTSCSRALTSSDHPDSVDWHHGQIGHNQLPRNIMLCGLERHGIDLEGR